MCKNITNKYLNIPRIKEMRHKINTCKDNPKLFIETIILPNDVNINIIQDGVLLIGTKQRVVVPFIKKILQTNKDITTLVYAGTHDGIGTVSVAYAAYRLGLKSEVYLSGKVDINSRPLATLHALNANIMLCSTFKQARILKNNNCLLFKEPSTASKKYFICPMGLNDSKGTMIKLLASQIKKAANNTLLNKIENPRIWLITGTGSTAMSILKAFPNAYLFILPIGGDKYKNIVREWAKTQPNVCVIKNEELLDNNVNNITERKLYYSSVSNYDDLIFPYVKKYATNNDFIWNVTSEDFI
jgi:hypothetical protein